MNKKKRIRGRKTAEVKIEKAVLHKADGTNIQFESEAALMEFLATNKAPFELEASPFQPEEGESWPESPVNSVDVTASHPDPQ
jgi:hypothetical protein